MCRGACGGIASFHELKCFEMIEVLNVVGADGRVCIFLRLKTAALGTNPWA